MSDDAPNAPETAQQFFWNAVACAAGADATAVYSRAGALPGPRRLEPQYLYLRALLLAQGLELAIKGWFMHRGVSLADVRRRAFNHDLVSLYQRAGQDGFPISGHAEIWLMTMITAVYRDDKELQYAKPARVSWPSSRAVRELLHESLLAVSAALYPAVDLDKVQTVRDPGRWLGLRTDSFHSYAGASLQQLRQTGSEALPQAAEGG